MTDREYYSVHCKHLIREVVMKISEGIKSEIDKMLSGIFLTGMTSKRGQTLVEYAFLLLLIAIVVMAMVRGMGGTLNNTYNTINSVIHS